MDKGKESVRHGEILSTGEDRADLAGRAIAFMQPEPPKGVASARRIMTAGLAALVATFGTVAVAPTAAQAAGVSDLISLGIPGSGAQDSSLKTTPPAVQTAGQGGGAWTYWATRTGASVDLSGAKLEIKLPPEEAFNKETGNLRMRLDNKSGSWPVSYDVPAKDYCDFSIDRRLASCTIPAGSVVPKDYRVSFSLNVYLAPTAAISAVVRSLPAGATLELGGETSTTPTHWAVTNPKSVSSVTTAPVTGSTTVSGAGDAGSTVTLRDADGKTVGTAFIPIGNAWSTELPAGFGYLTPTYTDINGNNVVGSPVYYNSYLFTLDSPASGSLQGIGFPISGKGQPGSPVVVKRGTLVVAETRVGEDGLWYAQATSNLVSGSNSLTVSNTTSDGKASPTKSLSVVFDSTRPAAPTAQPSNGQSVSGKATPGVGIVVKNAAGDVIGTGTAKPDGSFSLELSPVPSDGETISVYAKNTVGNLSEPAEVTVDAAAPAAPVVDPSNGSKVSGQAEPGATVVVKNEAGDVVGSVVADQDGRFSVVLDPAAKDGEKLSVVAVDAAKNESDATVVVVDAVAPAAPTVDPSNGSEVSGKTEPGAEVVVKDKDGNVIGQGQSDAEGNFTIPLSPKPNDGDVIAVEVTSPSGNTSEPAEVTVDAAAPAAPVVDPSNGSKVSGQAEPGATVVVKNEAG
ncbi:Ig-like domain-containing protein, partial [Leucobacter iarius]|uniref:Ig-like domain-containing protein n=1 Tax=Leucobacter iarius TaxID=333963 RepID=UPI0031DD4BA7